MKTLRALDWLWQQARRASGAEWLYVRLERRRRAQIAELVAMRDRIVGEQP